jgi:uncharacterized protein (TIGR00730 family)
LGGKPAYTDAAVRLGAGLAGAGFRLVYGAGDAGLTASMVRAALDAVGETFGVIPAHLAAREEARRAGHSDEPAPLVVAETMHERKKILFMNADAVVALPGGAGTLDQMLEVLTWRQLGLHRKPFFLLNVEGYWDPFLGLVDHMVAEAFAEPGLVHAVEAYASVDDLVDRLSARLYRRALAHT